MKSWHLANATAWGAAFSFDLGGWARRAPDGACLALPEQFLPFHLVIADRGRRMYSSLMLLAVEANGVVALRMMKLMRGGRSARREAKLMVSEKVDAAFEAAASLMAGASGDEIVHRYRQHVAKNAKRLSGRSRIRVLKRTRRRRK
jgi:hypothetical protein